jgi:hypothetical protein
LTEIQCMYNTKAKIPVNNEQTLKQQRTGMRSKEWCSGSSCRATAKQLWDHESNPVPPKKKKNRLHQGEGTNKKGRVRKVNVVDVLSIQEWI